MQFLAKLLPNILAGVWLTWVLFGTPFHQIFAKREPISYILVGTTDVVKKHGAE